MTKSMFLSKINYNKYCHIVDALMISNDNYEECMQCILDKYNLLNQRKPNQPTCQVNRFQKTHRNLKKYQHNSKNSNTFNRNIHNNNLQNRHPQNRTPSYYNKNNLPPTDSKYNNKYKDVTHVKPHSWKKMSRDDKLQSQRMHLI